MKFERGWAFAFLIIFLASFVFAASGIDQVAGSLDNKVQDAASQVDTAQKTLTNQQLRDEYLKKQWVSLIETKPGLKQILEGYRKVSPYSDPILEYIVGMAPELSLFFILVLVIWFFLVKYYFTIYEVLRDFSTFSDWASLAISFCIFGILLVLRLFQSLSIFFANALVALTEFLTSPVMKVIAFVVFVVAIGFLSKFSKQVKVLARHIRMQNVKRKKENEEEDLLNRQRNATENVEKIAKAVIGED